MVYSEIALVRDSFSCGDRRVAKQLYGAPYRREVFFLQKRIYQNHLLITYV